MSLLGFLFGLGVGCALGIVIAWLFFIKEVIPRMIVKLEKEGFLKVLKPIKEKWNK